MKGHGLPPALAGFSRLATAASARRRRPRGEMEGPLEVGWMEKMRGLLASIGPKLRRVSLAARQGANSAIVQEAFWQALQQLCALLAGASHPSAFEAQMLPGAFPAALRSLVEDLAALLAKLSLRAAEEAEELGGAERRAEARDRRVLLRFLDEAADLAARTRDEYLQALQSLAARLWAVLQPPERGRASFLEQLCAEKLFESISKLVSFAPGSFISLQITKLLRRALKSLRIL